MQVPMGGGNHSGGGATGGAAYAVLQLVGYAHSPLASPTTNNPHSSIWPPPASPLPSPRTPTSGSPSVAEPLGGSAAAPPPPPPQQVATTFVQADTSSFKEVVQKLTGATDDNKLPITMPARYAPRSAAVPPPDHHQEVNGAAISRPGFDVGPRKPAFKLHERRRNLRSLGIPPPAFRLNGRISPRAAELLSPSMLDLSSSLVLSPVTPLGGDPFDCPSSAGTSCNEASPTEEEKAIAQKRYYLHPSPLSTPRDSEPQLLPLFPLSPRETASESSS